MDFNNFQTICKEAVAKYVNDHLDSFELVSYAPSGVTTDQVYVVWYCKTLQHAKALLSTTLPDGMYYELTYNGDKDEIYLDAYVKNENVVLTDISSKGGDR